MREICHTIEKCARDMPHNGDICSRSLLQNIVSFIGLFCKRDMPPHYRDMCKRGAILTLTHAHTNTHSHIETYERDMPHNGDICSRADDL